MLEPNHVWFLVVVLIACALRTLSGPGAFRPIHLVQTICFVAVVRLPTLLDDATIDHHLTVDKTMLFAEPSKLFWLIAGTLTIVFLIPEHTPRRLNPRFSLPPLGLTGVLYLSFWTDLVRLLPSVTPQGSSNVRGWPWTLFSSQHIADSAVQYSRRLVLPKVFHILLRPALCMAAGVEDSDLPAWLPAPTLSPPEVLCELLLLSAIAIPDLFGLLGQLSPHIAVLNRSTTDAIFNSSNPLAVSRRRTACYGSLFAAWTYAAFDYLTIMSLCQLLLDLLRFPAVLLAIVVAALGVYAWPQLLP
ncbi:hypothetical protein C8R46DRAFT_304393 [Mycena filopes]|nr:hypothetical protein C8R46DRAFT_304393 [Mycena filopes]